MPTLELTGVTKRFHGAAALDALTLRVEEGELMCLLGPSGCGKTTTLRIIAGFENVDAGEVHLAGADITQVPPQKRDIGIVFQSYALFPHLTARENIGFGLKMRRKPADEIDRAVREALRLVRLEGVGERLPRQLSGGQQQRVALARAIAIRPRLLLLDEPLSNLDAKLRDEMREEIKRIQRAVGITTVFVTHDQVEALALADRMAVMDRGRIMQVDTPVNVYERPAHPFVASFIGQANLMHGRIVAIDGGLARLETAAGLGVVGPAMGFSVGTRAVAVLKCERIALSRARTLDSPNTVLAQVKTRSYLGANIQYTCTAGEESLMVLEPNRPGAETHQPGADVFLTWHAADVLFLADEGAVQ